MQPPEYRSFAALEVLATSMVMRLSLNDLEWLWRELAQRTQEKRRKASKVGGEPPILADNREALEPNRGNAP